jgi:hypothetical protein
VVAQKSGLRASRAIAGLLLVALAGAACTNPWRRTATAGDHVLPVRLPEPAYEELFPYYAELCALSQFERLGVVKGGNAGHGVLYLKGVCRVPDAPFPTLEMCPEVVNDLHDPRHGTGISANERLKNVNWVAYPGRDLFYNGDLKRGQTLTQAHFDATWRKLIDLGLLRGVEVQEEFLARAPGRPPEEVLAEYLLGSDVAIRFARSAFCSTLPLERTQVERVVDYLNAQNRRYALGGESYEWSFYYDNCIHILRNALAAADVWAPRAVGLGPIRQFFNMALPANSFVNLAVRANLFPLEDFGAVHADDEMRASLRDYGWLPTRHGALLKTAPIHTPNELYATRLNLYVAQGGFEWASTSFRLMAADARFTQLEWNLRWFEERYRSILAQRGARDWIPRSAAWRAERERYYAYVERQLADVERLLGRLIPAE